jgi:hypothetical protein
MMFLLSALGDGLNGFLVAHGTAVEVPVDPGTLELLAAGLPPACPLVLSRVRANRGQVMIILKYQTLRISWAF